MIFGFGNICISVRRNLFTREEREHEHGVLEQIQKFSSDNDVI